MMVFPLDVTAYKDKLIDYPASPDGRAFIGLVKLPITLNKSGVGYHGVLIQNAKRTLVQCNECGDWWRRITSSHLRTHGLTTEEYKIKNGLNRSTSLISDEQSYIMCQHALKNSKLIHDPNVGIKGRATPRKYRGARLTEEALNNRGICDKQLQKMIVDFILRFRYLPNWSNKGRSLMFKLYWRCNRGDVQKEFCRLGFPYRTNTGKKGRRSGVFYFPDHYSQFFSMKKIEDREMFFHEMLKRCPIIKELSS